MVGMEGVVVISVIFATIPCARGCSQGIILLQVEVQSSSFHIKRAAFQDGPGFVRAKVIVKGACTSFQSSLSFSVCFAGLLEPLMQPIFADHHEEQV